ncbi:MAG: hypothetical protein M1822_002262 [Bathelium mastoideum]|nr:MAG: hypothetical protein M1822_002262 [Bathelium mastoideum]
MNDEPSSSPAANQSANDNAQATGSSERHVDNSATQVRKHRERNKRMFNRKRAEFLEDILRAFDLIIYAELSAVYYMDCSFLRMILRAIIQFFYLTPKPAMFPDPPRNRPYPVGLMIGTNIFCALLHLWVSRPEAGEATRGYLHGGLLLDFVGQEGPSSKIHMVALDVLILLLQLVMLCAFIERQNLKHALASINESGAAVSAATQQSPGSSAPVAQDHDHEERGLLRSDPHALDDIELQALTPAGTTARTRAEESGDADERLASTRSTRGTDAHIFDAFNSGQMIVVDLHMWDTVRNQYVANLNQDRNAGTSFSTFSTHLPGGTRFGFRMRIGGRTLGQGENG